MSLIPQPERLLHEAPILDPPLHPIRFTPSSHDGRDPHLARAITVPSYTLTVVLAPHPSPLRALLALSALLLAIAIAVARHHVHIDPADLSTVLSLAHHRCGRLLLLTLLWSTAELTLLLPASPLRS